MDLSINMKSLNVSELEKMTGEEITVQLVILYSIVHLHQYVLIVSVLIYGTVMILELKP
jgi:hypothetical protein